MSSGFAVVAFIAVAAHAAALAEEIFAFVDDFPLDIAAGQHHVGGVAVLASGFDVGFREQRPQPVLVVAVGLLHAGGGAAVALVAGGASKFFGIVKLQQLRLRMADEGARVVVRLFGL